MAETEKKEWVFDDDAKARVAAELAAIDMSHEGKPTCALCGQRCNSLDRAGLCSKVSEAHKDWRAGVRADRRATKAGAR